MAMAASHPAIPHRALGKTGLLVSVLGFGASPFGNVFDDVKVSQEQANAAVKAAFAQGINYFDTSPFYGLTRSETVLGEALRGVPRSEVVVSTKVGRYGDSEFDFSASRVTTSVHESLKRLQLDYLDIVLCHDVEFGDLTQVVQEALPALTALKKEGLVKAIGFSCLPLKVARTVIDRSEPGSIDVFLSYCHYSLNDSTLEGFLPYLDEKGVAVITASPLAMGLLTKQGPSSWHPAPPELRLACSQAAQLAASEGVDIARLALAFAVQNPRIPTVLVGMGSESVVKDNVECVLSALGLVPNPTADLEAAVLPQVVQLLKPVQGHTWPSGPDHGITDE